MFVKIVKLPPVIASLTTQR